MPLECCSGNFVNLSACLRVCACGVCVVLKKGDNTGDLHPSQFNVLNLIEMHVDNSLY